MLTRMNIDMRRSRISTWLGAASLVAFAGFLHAENAIFMGYGEGNPGQTDIDVIVTATNDVPIHGYSVAFTYPSDVLTLSGVSVLGTNVEAEVDPDFDAPIKNSQLGIGGLAVIFSYAPEPVALKELSASPPGAHPRIIARITFNVRSNALGGTYPIELRDGIGTPANYNRFSREGTSIVPRLVNGSFVVKGGGNVLMLDTKLAFAGASSNLPIFASCLHPDPLGGFQVAVRYDKVALTLNSATFAGTTLDFELGEDLIELYNYENNPNFSPTHGRATAAAVFDYLLPSPDGQVLPPSTVTPQTFLRFSFSVGGSADDVKQYQELTLDNVSIPGLLDNRFFVGDRSLDPDLIHGKIYFSPGNLIGLCVNALTGAPIPGLTVKTDPDSGRTATTLGNGSFRLDNIPPGRYAILISGNDTQGQAYYSTRVERNPDTDQLIEVLGLNTDTSAGTIPVYAVPDITPPEQPFMRGLVNEGNKIDLSDAVFLLNYLFRGGERPPCLLSADVNDDNRADISDAVYLLNYLFTGGTKPPEPLSEILGGNGCAFDPTPGGFLDCASFDGCE